jgi:hypothetical protein
MNTVQVSVDTLTKAAGLVEVVKGIFDKQAADRTALKSDAEKLAKDLASNGFMPMEKVAGLTETLAKNPAAGFGIIHNFIKEAASARARVAKLEKEAKEHAEQVPSLGDSDMSKSASTKGGQRASDAVWERGFPV